MPISARMNRLFAMDGRCLVVAMDHGVFHEPSFLPGLENLGVAVREMHQAMPDAMQLTLGQAHLLQQIAGPRKPALILRVDTTNVYSRPTPSLLFSVVAEEAMQQAVALDAAAIVVNLIGVPGAESLQAECLRHISQLRPQCDRYGMPLMVEPLVLLPAPNGRMLESSLNVQALASLTRQAVEMGADLVKVDASERPEDFSKVVEAASGKPVLVRGGATMARDLLLSRSDALLRQGARGFVFGRNILQDADPTGLVGSLMRMLHANASGNASGNPHTNAKPEAGRPHLPAPPAPAPTSATKVPAEAVNSPTEVPTSGPMPVAPSAPAPPPLPQAAQPGVSPPLAHAEED